MDRSLIVLLLAAALSGAVVSESSAAEKDIAFPPNEAGKHAAAYFQAYGKGEEAMKRFFERHASAAALKRRPVSLRLGIYRDMREEHGALRPVEIPEFTESSVKVVARAERGGRVAITVLCEEKPPHSFIAVQVEDLPPEEGTPEGIDDGGYSNVPRMTEEEIAAALSAHLDSLAKADAFSGAVLLAKGDHLLLRHAYGLASRRFGVPNRPETKFNLGSINKAFTRLAIEQLAREGKLKLDDTIDRYISDYPRESASKITIRMLLEHRAGVPDIFGPRYETANHGRLRRVSDWVELIRDQPLHFAPGTREEYSNGGYVLLGAIIEKVTGQDYYDFIRERIYRPAGMKDTDSYETDDPVADLASGYTRRLGGGTSGQWRDNQESRPGRGSPAGGGYSTVDDLYRFARALHAGQFGGEPENGLGIAGGSPGTNAFLEISGDWTLVVLANMDPPAAEKVGLKTRTWLRSESRRSESRERRAALDGTTSTEIQMAASPDRIERHGPPPTPDGTSIPAGGADVAMEWAGHMATVSVMLNGEGPFRFAIDTGAQGTARIDAEVARRLKLRVVGSVQVGDPSGKNDQRATLVRIESLGIGGARFTGLTASIGDFADGKRGAPVDGVLGFGLFADCLLTLNFPDLRLVLRTGALPEVNGTDVLSFGSEDGIPSVPLRVGGVDVRAHVDAGAMGGISLPETLAETLPLASAPRVVGRARTVSNEFEIKAAELNGEVVLGGLTWSHPMVEFQPIFPVANVGARILRELTLTFDQRNHRLKLSRA